MGSKNDTYIEEVPDDVDMTQSEWDDLAYHTQYYHANEHRQKQVRTNQRKRRRRKKEKFNKIQAERGCVNCGEKEPVCLDWHHVGEKQGNVSEMISEDYAEEKIKKEISQCVVVCANCHRKAHNDIIDLPGS